MFCPVSGFRLALWNQSQKTEWPQKNAKLTKGFELDYAGHF
jgi:hypothetical protein